MFPCPQIVFFAALQLRCKTIAVLALQGQMLWGLHCKGWAEQGHFAIEYCRTLCGWHCGDTRHGHFAVGHCRGTPQLGTAGKLGAWALQGYLVVFALQGYLALRSCRDTLRLGTARILGGWALEGHLVVGHCRDT